MRTGFAARRSILLGLGFGLAAAIAPFPHLEEVVAGRRHVFRIEQASHTQKAWDKIVKVRAKAYEKRGIDVGDGRIEKEDLEKNVVLTSKVGNQVTGAVTIVPRRRFVGLDTNGHDRFEEDRTNLLMSDLVSMPGYQGKGQAHSLFEAVKKYARKHKIETISVLVKENNPHVPIYEHWGFTLAKTFNLPTGPEHSMVYKMGAVDPQPASRPRARE